MEDAVTRAGEAGAALTDGAAVAELMRHLAQRDGPGMYAEMERQLLRGEDGHRVLHRFFHECDLDHQKILDLTHDEQMIFAMLRLVARHPDEVASLTSFLIRATDSYPESFIRREIFNFLPVFLNHHGGAHPELRRELEAMIVRQLELGGHYVYKITLAMRDLQFNPPARAFLPVLSVADRERAALAFQALVARGEEGRAVLREYADTVTSPDRGLLEKVLRELAVAEYRESETLTVLDALMADSRPEVRSVATLLRVGFPADGELVPRLVEYLNSAEALPRRRALILRVRRSGREELLVGLRQAAADVESAELRNLLLEEK